MVYHFKVEFNNSLENCVIMAETTILFQGKQSEKIVEGNKHMVTPFVGVAQNIGLGIIFNHVMRTLQDTKGNPVSEFNPVYKFDGGIGVPQDLVAAYRGMLMIQGIPEIELGRYLGGTLDSCYTAAWDISIGRQQFAYIRDIESKLGTGKLEAIMDSQLPSDEFDEAIRFLQENGREFGVEPLVRELSKGTLQYTPRLEKLALDYAQQQVTKQQLYAPAAR